MATARKHSKEITTTETVYTLELSEEEATALRQYFEDGEAHGSDGPGLLDNIYYALKSRPEAQPTPLAVGDRVRVDDGVTAGLVGTLKRIDPADEILPYLVEYEDGVSWWTKGVERA